MIAFLSTFVALLPLVLGAGQMDGDVDLGVNVSSEMSHVAADEALSAGAVESAAAADIVICINKDCISVLVQFDESWILIIDCGDGEPQTYTGTGEYGGTLCGVSP